jgi:hypothetical protein
LVGAPPPKLVVEFDVDVLPPEVLPPRFFGVTLMLVWTWVDPPIPGFMDFPTVLPDPDTDPVEPEVLPEVVPVVEPEVGVCPLPVLPGGPAVALTQLPPESRTWPEGHDNGWPWPWLP